MSELDGMNDMSCDEFAEVASELALGVLTGRERARALAHLDGCEACREQVRELSMVGDELLALLPSAEPPAGFESRVLDRLGLTPAGQSPHADAYLTSAPPETSAPSAPSDPADPSDIPGRPAARETVGDHGNPGPVRPDRPARPDQPDRPANRPDRTNRPAGRPRRTLSRRLLAAAAVAVALIGGGVGWGLRDATAPAASSASSAFSTAALVTSDHTSVGQVFVYNRSPWWMYMSVNMESQGNATVTCQLEMADGRYQNVGQFKLSDGYGSWGSSPYTAGPGPILGARLLSANGTVLATATF
jgi:anti-sigma-K factor RskA